MATSPICLLQWLEPREYRETKAALKNFADEVNIEHVDVQTKDEAGEALQTWFRNNAGNTQFCFVGAHGVKGLAGNTVGVGATGKTGEYAKWREIWDWFAQGELLGGLWLGACQSSHAAAALSSRLTRSKTRSAIPYIYGFKDAVYPTPEIEQILLKLLEFTRTEQVCWLDEELGLLRAAVPGTAIELYYPASTSAQTVEYLNVDQMPARIGMTFRELLEMQAGVGLGRPKRSQRTLG